MAQSHTSNLPKDGEVIRLWPADAPLAQGKEDHDIPTLTICHPTAPASGAAMIVCPGGGYGMLADHEGEPVARWLNGLGIFAVVLKYRLGPRYRHPVMLMDASRAMRTVRSRAKQWNIRPDRIGILGFSAGGHLAASLCTHFDGGHTNSADEIERVSSRPDVGVLLYPVITMQKKTHGGSRNNLLGPDPDPKLIDLMSNEMQVTPRTPPAFLFHTVEDGAVDVENSMEYAAALRRASVKFEMHIFERGGHGVGLATNDPVLKAWPGLCAAWLRQQDFYG